MIWNITVASITTTKYMFLEVYSCALQVVDTRYQIEVEIDGLGDFFRRYPLLTSWNFNFRLMDRLRHWKLLQEQPRMS